MTTHLQSPIHLQLPLSGMSCANCAGRIATSLNKLDGVSATVNFALEQAAIELASPDRLSAVLDSIKSQGYDYGSETFVFQITGMTCAGCSARLNKMLAALPGVISAEVNFSIEQARIVLVPGMQTPPLCASRSRRSALAPSWHRLGQRPPPAVAGAGSAGGRHCPSGADPGHRLGFADLAAAGGDAGHGRTVPLASARLAGAAARHPGAVLDRGPFLSRRLARHQEPRSQYGCAGGHRHQCGLLLQPLSTADAGDGRQRQALFRGERHHHHAHFVGQTAGGDEPAAAPSPLFTN